ncbi:hypothetical protein P308_19440 [Pseudomonas piscis]|nr:hypothetical protein P308_19495 [Pseudomonas piscis]ERO65403.1 hypothetical protein P308_19440 [Pseudomonas piscis]
MHAPGRADEQRLVQVPAQARQGIAHRRLAEIEPQGGPGQVLLLHQGIEHPQQVEVQALDIQLHE